MQTLGLSMIEKESPSMQHVRLSSTPVGKTVSGSSASATSVSAKPLKSHARTGAKAVAQTISLLVSLPFAMLAGFGRFGSMFRLFSHSVALVPGLPGDYLRVAYYYLTLNRCSLYSRISFGTFFAQSCASVGEGVYIGTYCVLGGCNIGDRTQIASHVQTLGGQHQHRRGPDGRILGADEKGFSTVTIGEDCWIGASAILMADVGPRSTIGAGAVVTRPISADVVAVGNPARVLKSTTQATQAAAPVKGKEELVC